MKTLNVKQYQRTIQLQDVTFCCKYCAQTVTEQQYPGPQRIVCRECINNPERKRQAARERKRAQRARGKES